MRKSIPVYSVKVPEYHVRQVPDYPAVWARIDAVIIKHFLGKRVAIRCIGTQEHPGKTRAELIRIIRKLGTDRYDSCRSGVRYENVEKKCIDFFALDFKVTARSKIMEKFIRPFYEYPKQQRMKPIRLDLVMLYDRKQVSHVMHSYDGKRKKRDGFVFKDPSDRKAALLGIVKIL